MIQTEYGSVFIGFTGAMTCKKCHNTSHMHLRQSYTQQWWFFVDQGTNFSQVVRVCGVCEDKVVAGHPKTLLRKGDVQELHRMLDEGREHTKRWFMSMPESDRDKMLERYYSLEAFDFMRYLLK